MPKFRLMASVSWVAGSDADLGEGEFDSEEEAAQAAFEAAAERIDCWAEPVDD